MNRDAPPLPARVVRVSIAGIAFAGDRRISRVDVFDRQRRVVVGNRDGARRLGIDVGALARPVVVAFAGRTSPNRSHGFRRRLVSPGKRGGSRLTGHVSSMAAAAKLCVMPQSPEADPPTGTSTGSALGTRRSPV